MNGGLGRIECPDARDREFPVSATMPKFESEAPAIPRRYWWANGWWGNQGRSSECVAYSWMHFIEDGPVVQDLLEENRQVPFYDTTSFYQLCQKHDPWAGEDYDGTSVRTGAKILKKLGIIESYRWAFDIEEVIKTLKHLGPMVAGTRWYSNMTNPNNKNVMLPRGRSEGGHAYLLNGVNDKRGVIRVKNSWGRQWGSGGHSYIQYEDFEKLMKEGGEACIAFENKMVEVPRLTFS